MEDSRISHRYALALYELAGETNQLDQVFADMGIVAETCLDSKELLRVLSSPLIRETKKNNILTEIFTKSISDLSQRFITLVVTQNREVSLPAIALEYIKLVKDFKGIKTAYLTSAQPLDDETRKKILARLKEQTGREVELIEKIDPELMGGFTLSMEGQLIDASVRNTLHQLRNEFINNSYKNEL